MIIQISSRKNQVIRQAVAFIHSSAERKAANVFVIEGARLCYDAALSGLEIEQFFFTSQAREKYKKEFSALLTKAQKAYEIENHVAELLADTKNSQGIFCICQMQSNTIEIETLKRDQKYIALENIQNPSNLGAILRTADALGIETILLSKNCCDLYNPKTLRAAMGAIFHVSTCTIDSFPETLKELHKRGFQSFATTPAKDAKSIASVDFPKGSIILIGNEGAGLQEETIKACSKKITIPMLGKSESLNAATAASILMWEMIRKQVE